MKPKILVFAGSLRTDSTNKKLAQIAMKGAEKAGAQVTYIDLKDYPLPIYDGDIEAKEGLPQNALKLKELIGQSDGWIIASPEYNSSISAVLKNVIDWVSRPATPNEVYLSCFIDKAALLLSASPSDFGGMRGLVHLRAILQNLYAFVLPRQKTVSKAFDAFDLQGNLKDEKEQKSVEDLGKQLTDFLTKMKS